MTNLAILDFRMELDVIATFFKTGEFDSKALSEQLIRTYGSGPLVSLEALRRVRPKQISNDLRRLYDMKLVGRRRIRRQVRTGSGKICYRGYEYKYHLTKQAVSYLGYRAGVTKEEPKGLDDLTAFAFIQKVNPEEKREASWKAYVDTVGNRPGKRRFPGMTVLLDKVVKAKLRLQRDSKVGGLEARIKELEAELGKAKVTTKIEVAEKSVPVGKGNENGIPAVAHIEPPRPTQSEAPYPETFETLVKTMKFLQMAKRGTKTSLEPDLESMRRALEQQGYKVTGPGGYPEPTQKVLNEVNEEQSEKSEIASAKKHRKITLMATARKAAKNYRKSITPSPIQ